MNNITINYNQEHKGIEISFISKPDKEYLDLLKANGFRWHRVKKLWYAKENSKSRSVVDKIKDNDDLLKFNGIKAIDGYMGSCGFVGINNEMDLSSKERNALIKKEFKKYFPMFKVSIRSGKGGYLDSVNIKLTVSKKYDLLTLEEFKKYFWDLSSKEKFGYFYEMDANIDQCNADNNAYIEKRYHELIDQESSSVLSNQAKKAMNWLKTAFASFNRDESNSMVDYFDRDIYDFYQFQWVD